MHLDTKRISDEIELKLGEIRSSIFYPDRDNEIKKILINNNITKELADTIIEYLKTENKGSTIYTIGKVKNRMTELIEKEFYNLNFTKINIEFRKDKNNDKSIIKIIENLEENQTILQKKITTNKSNIGEIIKELIINSILLKGYKEKKRIEEKLEEARTNLSTTMISPNGKTINIDESISKKQQSERQEKPIEKQEFREARLKNAIKIMIRQPNRDRWDSISNERYEILEKINEGNIEAIYKILEDKGLNKDFYKDFLKLYDFITYKIDTIKLIEILKKDIKDLINLYKKRHDNEFYKGIIINIGIMKELENEKIKEEKQIESENHEYSESIKKLTNETKWNNNEKNFEKIKECLERNKDTEGKGIIEEIQGIVKNGYNYYRELLVRNKNLSRYNINFNQQIKFIYEEIKRLLNTYHEKEDESNTSKQQIIKEITVYCSIMIELEKKEKIAELRKSHDIEE